MYSDVILPEYSHDTDACADIRAYFNDEFLSKNTSILVAEKTICLSSGNRLLIPTGLILDIPEGYSVRTHPRSSTGYKIGIHHPHDQGIIDADYYHQLFLLFYNMTEIEISIKHNQKLVQAEMIKKPIYEIIETKIQPSQKTDRIGGLGSTG